MGSKVYTASLRRPTGPNEAFVQPPCTKVDPDIFVAPRSVKKAKAICMTCPIAIRKDCLVTALSYPGGDPRGVYGGLSEQDRDDLRTRYDCSQLLQIGRR